MRQRRNFVKPDPRNPLPSQPRIISPRMNSARERKKTFARRTFDNYARATILQAPDAAKSSLPCSKHDTTRLSPTLATKPHQLDATRLDFLRTQVYPESYHSAVSFFQDRRFPKICDFQSEYYGDKIRLFQSGFAAVRLADGGRLVSRVPYSKTCSHSGSGG